MANVRAACNPERNEVGRKPGKCEDWARCRDIEVKLLAQKGLQLKRADGEVAVQAFCEGEFRSYD